MKKLFVLILALFILVPNSAFATSINDNTVKEKVIFEKEEIKDRNKIIDRAKKGITDVEDLPFEVSSSITKVDSENIQVLSTLSTFDLENLDEENFDLDIFTTTQKLKETQALDGTINTEYVTNAVVNAYDSKTVNKTDGSYVVSGVVSVRWEEKISGGVMVWQLADTSGSWSLLDTGFSLSNRRVEFGQLGQEACFGTQCKQTSYPTSNSFFYVGSSSWPWIGKHNQIATMTSNSYVTVTRGTSSFLFTINAAQFGL